MKVVVDKVLADNYMYYLIDTNTSSHEAFVVDLGDVTKVAEIARREEFEVKGALITHHHWDHSAGAADLAKEFPKAKIYGQDKSRIPALTDEAADNHIIKFNSIDIHCYSTPGHTTTHVCYYVLDNSTGERALFTGDTLFLAGCGKFFECKPSVMHDSISRLLEHIDDKTSMYFGHEYSITNLKFAKKVEPHNPRVIEKLEQCRQLLQNGKPTCPSTWKEEKQYNPFLRVGESAVKEFTGVTDPIEVLEKLREAKNSFKP